MQVQSNVFLVRPIPCQIFVWLNDEMLKLSHETNRTDISFILWPFIPLLNKSIYQYKVQCYWQNFKQYWRLQSAGGYDYLLLSLKVLYLKCDSKMKNPHFTFMNLALLTTKPWKENWTFWGFSFSITIWLVYVSSGGRTKDIVGKMYFGLLSIIGVKPDSSSVVSKLSLLINYLLRKRFR